MTLRFWQWVSIKPCKSAFGFERVSHTDGKEKHGEKPQNTAGNRNEDSAPQERKWPDEAIIRDITRALVLLIVFAWALLNLDAVLRFLGKALALFTPFLIGGAIAFLINVVLRLLEFCWNKVCRNAPTFQASPVEIWHKALPHLRLRERQRKNAWSLTTI